jgi:hypothetical protein
MVAGHRASLEDARVLLHVVDDETRKRGLAGSDLLDERHPRLRWVNSAVCRAARDGLPTGMAQINGCKFDGWLAVIHAMYDRREDCRPSRKLVLTKS